MLIAICDDKAADRALLRKLLEDYQNARRQTFQISEYETGLELCSDKERLSRYQIVFLNIGPERVDGLKAAMLIREMQPDVHTILVTSHLDDTLDEYRVKSTHFLLKEELKQSLGNCLDDILKDIEIQQRTVKFPFVEGETTLKVEDARKYKEDRHMRITSQILTRTSLETGIPIAQNGILDAMSNQNTAVDLLEAMERKQNTEKLSKLNEQYRELEETADNLGRYTSKLLDDGDNSLFHRAEEQNDTKDIVTEIRNMVTSYNEALELLQDADGSLNYFYYKELKGAVTDNAELLKSAGVTQSKDGSLKLDEKVLESADYDTLKKVFGSESDFTKKADYISGKVSENTSANMASTSNQYNARGYAYNSSFEASKYDHLG